MKTRRFFFYLGIVLAALSCGGNKENPETPGGNGGNGGGTPASLNAPAGLELRKSTETSLTFQWTAVQGAKGYTWTISKGTQSVDSGNTSNRNVEVKNLEKATTYTFSVKAVADGVTSGAATLEAKTAGTTDNPGTGTGTDLSKFYSQFGIPEVEEEDGQARAFPGAEGGGMYTTGGRGGKVLHVTSLEDTNTEGTLRWAVNQTGARTIVFDVAGTIALKSQLQIKNGDLTIAGQTAPGDGICIKNYTFRIHANNVIVRFIRCRMGDEAKTEDDAMQVMDKYGDSFQNIIIDHCSVSWSTDECASFYGMKDFTFQWNIVSESLRNSVHDKGPHGYGGIWGGTNATYHHNLLAHHDSRNPRIDHDFVSHQKGPVSIFNNVVYNWEGNTCYGGESSSNNGSEYRKYNFFNNYYKPGPVTPSNHRWLLQPTTSCSNCGGTILPGHFYLDGNILEGSSEVNSNNWTAGISSSTGVYIDASKVADIQADSPYAMDCYQSVHSASACFDPVLSYVGASYSRDRIDARIADETKKGTYTYEGSNTNPKNKEGKSVERSYKGLIDTQTDVADETWVNGWPVYTYNPNDDRLKDADSDGMPNWFEEQFGLNKSSTADAQGKNLDPKGRYTNLEMYLHYLVKDIVAGGNAGATYKKL